MKKEITITPVRVADLLAEGERMPVYVHVIDHPDARVLVDTGMTELHPAVADLDPCKSGEDMNVQEQIKEYIATQPEPKRSDMQELHGIILEVDARM